MLTHGTVTNSMGRSPSWEAISHLASQEIPCLLWNPKVHLKEPTADPRPCVTFHSKLDFYGEALLAPRPTPKFENHPLSETIANRTLYKWYM
jgi:hypothetical protein